MTDWNYGDVWETVADVQPDRGRRHPGRPQHHVAPSSTAGPTASRSSSSTSARCEQDKVALYLYNSPEYLQATFAAVKVGLVPVNTNYRYGDDELSLPVGQRRRRSRSCSTARSPTGSRGSSTACPA